MALVFIGFKVQGLGLGCRFMKKYLYKNHRGISKASQS